MRNKPRATGGRLWFSGCGPIASLSVLILLSPVLVPVPALAQASAADGGTGDGSRAAGLETGPEMPSAPYREPLGPFRKRGMTLQVQGTWLQEAWGVNEGPARTLAGASVAFGYSFLAPLSLHAEVLLLGVHQRGGDAFMSGLCVYPRWAFLRRGRFSLFMDAGAGISLASRRLPEPNGTEFNFLILAGPGFTLRVCDAWMLTAAFRYMHISNSSIQGADRNPSIDTLGVQAGVLFSF